MSDRSAGADRFRFFVTCARGTEGALRRDLSTALKERVMQAGLILLLLFMATVIYFDISKNFFH